MYVRRRGITLALARMAPDNAHGLLTSSIKAMLPDGPASGRVQLTLRWHRDPCGLLDDAAERFGTPFTLRLLGRSPAVVVSDAEHVREVVCGPPELFMTGAANRGFRIQAGPFSVMCLDGADHRRHRRTIQPAFRPGELALSGERTWKASIESIRQLPCGETLRFLDIAHRLTLDLIFRTILGVTEPGHVERLRRAVDALAREVSPAVMLFPWLRVDLGRFNRWGRFLKARAELDAIVRSGVERERARNGAPDSLLAQLAAPPSGEEPLSVEEIQDEIVTFLAVGHATTAAALTWTVQWLLAAPEVHSRLVEEVCDAVESAAGPPRFDAMPYLEATILESLRLSPPVLLMVRKLARDHSVAGFDLPAGTLVRPSPYLAQRDPRRFPEPERFRPERFLGARPGPYDFFPFGGGQRVCLGAAHALDQMRLILAALLSQVELSLQAAPTRQTRRVALLISPAHGTPVRIERRLDSVVRI